MRRLCALFTLAAIAGLAAMPSSSLAATCDDYSNQADAQRAADTRDADSDGLYCEALPCPCATGGGGSSQGSGDGGATARRRAQERRQAAARQRAAVQRRRREAERRQRLARQSVERGRWRVYEVVDGDTVKIKRTDGSRSETVRLLGIDTPETRKPATPIECGGPQATAGMLAATFATPTDTDGDTLYDTAGGLGVLVSVQTDRTEDFRDRYGRLLAYLDAEADLPPFAAAKRYDLGRVQVLAGNSTAYRYEGHRFARFGSYRKAHDSAKTARRGAWGRCGGNFHMEQVLPEPEPTPEPVPAPTPLPPPS